MFLDYMSIARILEEYFESYDISGRFIRAKPKNRSVNQVFIRKAVERFLSFDPHIEIIGVVDVVGDEEMDESAREAYRKLKLFEFEAYPGLIFGKPKFKPTPTLSYLSERLNLTPSESLVNKFKNNKKFVKLFRKVRPVRLKVELESFPNYLNVGLVQEEGLSVVLREAVLSYYREPERIRFYVNTACILSSPFVGKTLKNSLNLMLASSEMVRDFLKDFGL